MKRSGPLKRKRRRARWDVKQRLAPRWQLERMWRALVAERDRYCQMCLGPGEEVHHVFGRIGQLRVLPENGWLLCRACHAKFHKNLRLWRAHWRVLHPERSRIVDAVRFRKRGGATAKQPPPASVPRASEPGPR